MPAVLENKRQMVITAFIEAEKKRGRDPYRNLQSVELRELGMRIDRCITDNSHPLCNKKLKIHSTVTNHHIDLAKESIAKRNRWTLQQHTGQSGPAKLFKHCLESHTEGQHHYPFVNRCLPGEYCQGVQLLPVPKKGEELWNLITSKTERMTALLMLKAPEPWMLQLMELAEKQHAAKVEFVIPTRDAIDGLKKVVAVGDLLPVVDHKFGFLSTRLLIWAELEYLRQKLVLKGSLSLTQFVTRAGEAIALLSEAELTPIRIRQALGQGVVDRPGDLFHLKSIRHHLAHSTSCRLKSSPDHNLHPLVYDFIILLEDLFRWYPEFDDLTKDGLFQILFDALQIQKEDPTISNEALLYGIASHLNTKVSATKGIGQVIKESRSRWFSKNQISNLRPHVEKWVGLISQRDFDTLHPEINPMQVLRHLENSPLDTLRTLLQGILKALITKESTYRKISIILRKATDDLRPLLQEDEELKRKVIERTRQILEPLLLLDPANIFEGDGQEFLIKLVKGYGKQSQHLGSWLKNHSLDLQKLPPSTQRVGLLVQHLFRKMETLRASVSRGATDPNHAQTSAIQLNLGRIDTILRWAPDSLIRITTVLVNSLAGLIYNFLVSSVKEEKVATLLKYLDRDAVRGTALLLADLLEHHELRNYRSLLKELQNGLDPSKPLDTTALAKAFSQASVALVNELGHSGVLQQLLQQTNLALRRLSTTSI